jgi:hypothetical protein
MIAAILLIALTPPPLSKPAAPTFCRTVHGRMMTANGNPALRIWEVGTRHYLGVDVDLDLSLDTLPGNIRRTWMNGLSPRATLLDASLYGDFRVCAWKVRRAGEMELVRVMSGRNLVVGSYR